MLSLGPRGTALIQSFEQLRLTAYQDQRGVWTIGWGHTPGVVEYQTTTPSEADEWFTQDTQSACNAVMRAVDVPMTQNQFDALVMFVFNIGCSAFFISTMRKKLNAKDFDGASKEFKRWNIVDGHPNSGLDNRRAAEKKLFLT